MPDLPAAIELTGASLVCRTFRPEDIHPAYLAWLNDPEVNRYSRRRYVRSTAADALNFLQGLSPDEQVLAIHLREDGRHIGNIQFGPVDWLCRLAEIRILIGDKEAWGGGYGTEAIGLVTKYLFEELKLHRVEANSCNPAFIRCTEKLGWTVEGRLRERFMLDGEFVDYYWMSILEEDFKAANDE